MEQIKKFLHGKGFALVLAACLLAAAAAGVWAVRTVRDELKQNLTDLTNPSSTARQTIPEPEPDPDVGLEEEELWLDLPDTAEQAANSVAGVPQPVPGSSSASSGAASGSGSVHEPSALRTDSAPAASSAAPASTQPFSGRVLNAYSGDELVYSKTLGDWRTHNGVDYACAEGSEVSAPCSGKVTETGTDGRWSSVVTLEDASGRLWRVGAHPSGSAAERPVPRPGKNLLNAKCPAAYFRSGAFCIRFRTFLWFLRGVLFVLCHPHQTCHQKSQIGTQHKAHKAYPHDHPDTPFYHFPHFTIFSLSLRGVLCRGPGILCQLYPSPAYFCQEPPFFSPACASPAGLLYFIW